MNVKSFSLTREAMVNEPQKLLHWHKFPLSGERYNWPWFFSPRGNIFFLLVVSKIVQSDR